MGLSVWGFEPVSYEEMSRTLDFYQRTYIMLFSLFLFPLFLSLIHSISYLFLLYFPYTYNICTGVDPVYLVQYETSVNCSLHRLGKNTNLWVYWWSYMDTSMTICDISYVCIKWVENLPFLDAGLVTLCIINRLYPYQISSQLI